MAFPHQWPSLRKVGTGEYLVTHLQKWTRDLASTSSLWPACSAHCQFAGILTSTDPVDQVWSGSRNGSGSPMIPMTLKSNCRRPDVELASTGMGGRTFTSAKSPNSIPGATSGLAVHRGGSHRDRPRGLAIRHWRLDLDPNQVDPVRDHIIKVVDVSFGNSRAVSAFPHRSPHRSTGLPPRNGRSPRISNSFVDCAGTSSAPRLDSTLPGMRLMSA